MSERRTNWKYAGLWVGFFLAYFTVAASLGFLLRAVTGW